MKWFLYNGLFAVAYLAMLPSFLLRMKRRGGYRARMGDRFGRYPEGVARALAGGGRRPVWLHAVSVGEVQVAVQLMRALRARDRSVRFVFSTTSSTGWQTAERELARLAADGLGSDGDALIYNPLDFNGCVRRALDRVNPRAVILTETEIWPNFIRAVRRRGIPLFLVNARLSDRSAPRYRALRWFFGEIFRAFTKIYAQSDLDARRLADAGADRAQIAVTGSFKFDVARRDPAKERELAAWVAGEEGRPAPAILLGGSTWPGEDEVLLGLYAELVKTHPEVVLVLAPRHFEKADAVEANIRRAGFACVRRGRTLDKGHWTLERGTLDKGHWTLEKGALDGGGEKTTHQRPMSNDQRPTTNVHPPMSNVQQPMSNVYLCDTTGELMGLFGIATVVFVGKSLCAHGSQNMIEPCLCGKPTLVGPYTENFRPVMSDLLAAEAVVQVPDAAALKRAVFRFFDDPAARAAQGARAQAAVARRCGVVGRCADELLEALR